MRLFEDSPNPDAAYFLESTPNYSSIELISTTHSKRSNFLFGLTRQRILVILFLSSLLISCAGNGNPYMTQDQLLAAIHQGTPPAIVDVRSQSEYESGHVPGALHLPFYAMWSRHEEIKAKPEDPIVLYCEHGPRAGIAKFALWTMGYINIVYLDGHIFAWKQGDLPMENTSEKLR